MSVRPFSHVLFDPKALERELAAYRLIGGQIAAVTSPQELEALDEALALDGPFANAQMHVASARAHLSSRQNLDYRNSIKESISAVEAAAALITGKPGATLGAALATLEKARKLHDSLKAAFSALYGYTSDANGICAHLWTSLTSLPLMPNSSCSTCSSFVNYFKSLA